MAKRRPDEAHVWTDEQLKELEQRIAAEYKKAADELQEKIDAYFASFAKRDAEQKALIGTIVNGREYTAADYQQWRLAQIGRGERFEALRDRLAERMTNANEVAAANINDATPGLYSLNRNYAAYTIEQQVGRDVGFDLWDEQTVKRLIVEQPDLMPYYPPARAVDRGIDLAYGKRQITAQVTSGILQGESIKHLADRLQTNIPNMNRTSAIRAARTAVTGAQNAGRLDSYIAAEKMGIELERQWIATLDNRTRHDHAAADGQIVGTEEPFVVGGEELMYPGDPSGSPWNIYNCRCTQIARVKGVDMSDALRRDRYGVLPDMAFAQWENTKREEGALAIDWAEKNRAGLLEKSSKTGIISGALNPDSPRAQEHAERYYASVRKMTTDVARIAKNTGYSEPEIQRIKNFIFIDEHDLGDGRVSCFDASYEMAESWQRLIDGKNIQPHDLTLLRHEIMEKELMDTGYTQDEAHRITSHKFNYRAESEEYYGNLDKDKQDK